MRLLAVTMLAVLVGQSQSYPPPYPRAGTKGLLDNERVQVWDVSWPEGVPAVMHRPERRRRSSS